MKTKSLFIFILSWLLLLPHNPSAKAHATKQTPDLFTQFIGHWSRTKGPARICPDQVLIKKVAATKITLDNIRTGPQTSALYSFELNKNITVNSQQKYDKSKDKKLSHSYTLVSHTNTSIIGDALVSSHLWVSPNIEYTSTGIKSYRVDTNDTLILEKVISGYHFDPKQEDKRIQHRFATHSNGYVLNGSSWSCQFIKKKGAATASQKK